MKRVLLAFDGSQISYDIFECARQLNAHSPIKVVGIFLPVANYSGLTYSFGGVPAGEPFIYEPMPADKDALLQHIENFGVLCRQNDMDYSVLDANDRHVIDTISAETRYADLLVVSGSAFPDGVVSDGEPRMPGILRRSECPVMIVPHGYAEPNTVILAYDGSEQSLFAIKQFSYLFPFYTNLNTMLVFFSGQDTIPDRNHVEDFLHCHYKDVTITKLDLTHTSDIENWILGNGNPILVAGAYGRSAISEFFRKSFTEGMLENSRLKVFVAHK